jgi:hypothetical protein
MSCPLGKEKHAGLDKRERKYSLDQIPIRIPAVHTLQLPDRAGPVYDFRAFENLCIGNRTFHQRDNPHEIKRWADVMMRICYYSPQSQPPSKQPKPPQSEFQ